MATRPLGKAEAMQRSLDEARKIIADRDASFVQCFEAAALVSSSRESSLADLLACLRHRGLPAEIAATALYYRTGRPRVPSGLAFVTDEADWLLYLYGKTSVWLTGSTGKYAPSAKQ